MDRTQQDRSTRNGDERGGVCRWGGVIALWRRGYRFPVFFEYSSLSGWWWNAHQVDFAPDWVMLLLPSPYGRST